jgi:hypothetical protein
MKIRETKPITHLIIGDISISPSSWDEISMVGYSHRTSAIVRGRFFSPHGAKLVERKVAWLHLLTPLALQPGLIL